jgi:hypothetical protein
MDLFIYRYLYIDLHHKMITKKKHGKEFFLKSLCGFFCSTLAIVVIATPNANVMVVPKFLYKISII